MKFRSVGLLLVVLILLGVQPVFATVMDGVRHDLKPVTGYVVMAAGQEYILDLDSAQGVVIGDLLTVVEAGEKVIHPVSGKVIGSLDKTVAVLQVTRVKAGYSYASVVSGNAAALSPGTAVHRFSHLSAIFQDETGQNGDMGSQLKTALPELEWQENTAAASADLTFAATASGLQLRDGKGRLLRAYGNQPVMPAQQSYSTNAITAYAPAAPYAPFAPAAPAVPAGPVTYERPSAPYPSAAVNPLAAGFSMEFPRFNMIGQYGRSTVMADFETVDNQLLLASTNGGSIEVFSVQNSLELVATGDSATMGQILSLSWWQPQPGELYLAVTVWADKRINSDLLQLQGGQLVPVVRAYSALLAGFDMDGDGRSEQLLSQDFNRETFYGAQVRQLTLTGNRLAASPVGLDLPRNFRLFGALFTDINGDGTPESVFIHNRRLYVYSGEKQLYKSSKELGASISTVTYDIDPDAQNPMIASAVCEVSPVAADLDGDGIPEIVAIGTDGSMLQAVGVASAINKSWLAVFKYQNGMLLKGSVGDKLERPLQGLTVSNGQALMVATDAGGLLDKAEASYVLSVPVR
ncbi:MAG: VCBS repeat-containing protein [Desulfuromonadaceae bacterium]|nr:VCBS repeat-containing protein [Desulfuromonadaceae bacterium]